jgi:hypothetical protein
LKLSPETRGGGGNYWEEVEYHPKISTTVLLTAMATGNRKEYIP